MYFNLNEIIIFGNELFRNEYFNNTMENNINLSKPKLRIIKNGYNVEFDELHFSNKIKSFKKLENPD